MLVVDDDKTLTSLLRDYLKAEGCVVTVVNDGAGGLAEALSSDLQLLILDLMLPGLDGWEICREVRARRGVPILLLTALDEEDNKVRGLDLGADDYVTKPFGIHEFLARVRALLRRGGSPPAERARPPLAFPGLRVNPATHVVELEGQRVYLTPKEFDLLCVLVEEPGRVVPHAELIERIWRYVPDADHRLLHTHMQRLRRKLATGSRDYIRTVWGVGYTFTAGDS